MSEKKVVGAESIVLMLSRKIDKLKQQEEFMLGFFYGLLLGIFGNFFASFGYGLFESWIMGKFDTLFYGNLLFFMLFLVMSSFLSRALFCRYMRYKIWRIKLEKQKKEEIKKYA